MGHGGFQSKSGRSGLLFEGPNREEHWVLGRELAERLAPFFSSLRLAVLNSCYGAAGRRRADQEALGSVTSALIAGGLTAVVGM